MTTEPLDVLISKALLGRLLVDIDASTATSSIVSPAIKVALPLIPFTPVTSPAPIAYLDARAILRAESDHPGLAFASSNINRGIFQVDVVTPDNKGENPGLRLAALVAARFAIGTELVAGSYKVQIQKLPTIAAAVKDAPWVRFPVSIRYLVIN